MYEEKPAQLGEHFKPQPGRSILIHADIFLDVIPPTHTWQASLRICYNKKTKRRFIVSHETAAQKTEKNNIRWLLKEYQSLSDPLEGPVLLIIDFIYPYRKQEPQRVLKSNRLLPKDTKPDCSNMVKSIEDILTEQKFWKDDAQVQDLHITKWWGPKPGIWITIGQYENED